MKYYKKVQFLQKNFAGFALTQLNETEQMLLVFIPESGIQFQPFSHGSPADIA